MSILFTSPRLLAPQSYKPIETSLHSQCIATHTSLLCLPPPYPLFIVTMDCGGFRQSATQSDFFVFVAGTFSPPSRVRRRVAAIAPTIVALFRNSSPPSFPARAVPMGSPPAVARVSGLILFDCYFFFLPFRLCEVPKPPRDLNLFLQALESLRRAMSSPPSPPQTFLHVVVPPSFFF